MVKVKGKFYYGNIQSNENITAKTNVTWVADFTTLKLFQGQKAEVFICVDIHSNLIVASTISKKVINATSVVRALEKAIHKRFKSGPSSHKLIIHTDRGSQFSGKIYNDFVKKYDEYFIPSMSRENTPTDNAVAERFMRTFKEHEINGVTVENDISNVMGLQPKFSAYRSYLNKYVNSLNEKPNKKAFMGPERYDKGSSSASMLMLKPNYLKAQSSHINQDPRLEEVERYKSEKQQVMGILAEIAARKAEVVNETPFDSFSFEDKIVFEMMENKLNEIYSIIESNPETTKKYVIQALEPVEDSLEALHNKVDTLLSKSKINREVLPLRDPIDVNLFPLFFANAGSQYKRQADLKQAQLRVAYTLLYHTGLRVNEIRQINEQQIIDSIKAGQISIIHHKTKQPYIHVLSNTAVQNLKRLKNEFEIIFNKYKFKSLFGKEKPIHKKSLIRFLNEDLKRTCELNEIPFNIKSHSFRINMVSSLLKKTSVQKAAQIIGHKDIKSTMTYQRYAIPKEEIRRLLEEIENTENGQ